MVLNLHMPGTVSFNAGGLWCLQAKSLDKASDLFDEADQNGDGKLQVQELAELLRKASAEFPQLAEHASFLTECVSLHSLDTAPNAAS